MGFKIDAIPGKEVSIRENNEPVLTYCYGKSISNPYLHPLSAPNGEIITDGYSEKDALGLYFSLGTVRNSDHKQVELKRKTTTLDAEILDSDVSDEYLYLIGNTKWHGANLEILEKCRITVQSIVNSIRIIDLSFEIEVNTHQVKFMENIGLGFSTVEMEHRKTANSDGKIGELEVNQQASEWATLCGISSNTAIGLAIFPHPSNGKTSFLAKDAYQGYLFAQTPQFTLDVNTTQTLEYRVLVYEGDMFTTDLSEFYNEYSSECS